MLKKSVFTLVLVLLIMIAGARNSEKKTCQAVKISGEVPVVDGKLDESVWKLAKWYNNFIQYQPVDSGVSSQKTEFTVLYDNYNIYVGMKMFDTAPDSIEQRITRRDQIDGDVAGVEFDSFDDRRTAFAFAVTAAGVKYDFIVSDHGNKEDVTWNPIWWTETSKDSLGWYAEMRIPLTQLRFEEKKDEEWGIEAIRYLFRKEETSVWSPISRKQASFVSQFGRINGLQGIESRNIVDFMPYIVAKREQFEKDPENPFLSKGHQNSLDVGVDAKIGVTNYLTLDMTVNPDFGQVEADPSEVNLTTYETFFEERRPFFIEGKNIMDYGLNFGDGDLADENMFYSRRIGRSPHYNPELQDSTYSKIPRFSRILGAAKITGKTSNGWSVGLLESMTGKEYAQIKGKGIDNKIPVEPFTNYSIGRLQKDFNKGNTTLGFMLTAVNRRLKDEDLDTLLHTSAYSGGLDFVHKWDNKNWELDVSFYGSRVAGTPEAITRTQRSYIHLFQRPDATWLGVDSARTSLSGYGGKIVLGEYGGNLRFLSAVTVKSPGLELNDVGYLRQADDIFEVFWMGYRIFKPVFIFRELYINLNQWTEWNFGGELISPGGNININSTFKNYWVLGLGTNINGREISTSALRGGPALKVPGNYNFWISSSSNEQKKMTVSLNGWLNKSFEKSHYQENGINMELAYRPLKSLKFSLNPGYEFSKTKLQYITQASIDRNNRYIFGSIQRNTINASFRINLNLTPELSLEYWGQPFIASGKYSHFKRITDYRAKQYTDRFKEYATSEIKYDELSDSYSVTESGFGKVSFDQPDFNINEFLSNMVIRWEYNPGSTLYLVWSQNLNSSTSDGNFNFRRDIDHLFDANGNHIFLVKLSYRLGR